MYYYPNNARKSYMDLFEFTFIYHKEAKTWVDGYTSMAKPSFQRNLSDTDISRF